MAPGRENKADDKNRSHSIKKSELPKSEKSVVDKDKWTGQRTISGEPIWFTDSESDASAPNSPPPKTFENALSRPYFRSVSSINNPGTSESESDHDVVVPNRTPLAPTAPVQLSNGAGPLKVQTNLQENPDVIQFWRPNLREIPPAMPVSGTYLVYDSASASASGSGVSNWSEEVNLRLPQRGDEKSAKNITSSTALTDSQVNSIEQNALLLQIAPRKTGGLPPVTPMQVEKKKLLDLTFTDSESETESCSPNVDLLFRTTNSPIPGKSAADQLPSMRASVEFLPIGPKNSGGRFSLAPPAAQLPKLLELTFTDSESENDEATVDQLTSMTKSTELHPIALKNSGGYTPLAAQLAPHQKRLELTWSTDDSESEDDQGPVAQTTSESKIVTSIGKIHSQFHGLTALATEGHIQASKGLYQQVLEVANKPAIGEIRYARNAEAEPSTSMKENPGLLLLPKNSGGQFPLASPNVPHARKRLIAKLSFADAESVEGTGFTQKTDKPNFSTSSSPVPNLVLSARAAAEVSKGLNQQMLKVVANEPAIEKTRYGQNAGPGLELANEKLELSEHFPVASSSNKLRLLETNTPDQRNLESMPSDFHPAVPEDEVHNLPRFRFRRISKSHSPKPRMVSTSTQTMDQNSSAE